jgi:hypothetical protein
LPATAVVASAIPNNAATSFRDNLILRIGRSEPEPNAERIGALDVEDLTRV